MRRFITKAGPAIATIFVCGTMVLPCTASAGGNPQPFKIKGTVEFTPVAGSPGLFTLVDIGESTYMGRFYNEGWMQFNADLSIAAGEGVCHAANGDYNRWKSKPNSNTVISLGGVGRFEGVEGYFNSTIISIEPHPDGSMTGKYIGEGQFTFPAKIKGPTPDGKTIPYTINGTLYLTARDLVNSPGLYDFVDTGNATHQGHYWNEGWIQFNANGSIAAGAGTCWMANGDPSNWVMEANTGKVIILGATEGRFEGVTGYFNSTLLSQTVLDAQGKNIITTYVGVGLLTKPDKSKGK